VARTGASCRCGRRRARTGSRPSGARSFSGAARGDRFDRPRFGSGRGALRQSSSPCTRPCVPCGPWRPPGGRGAPSGARRAPGAACGRHAPPTPRWGGRRGRGSGGGSRTRARSRPDRPRPGPAARRPGPGPGAPLGQEATSSFRAESIMFSAARRASKATGPRPLTTSAAPRTFAGRYTSPARRSRSAGSATITNRQGSRLRELPASRPASSTRRTMASGIARSA